jgi:integrase
VVLQVKDVSVKKGTIMARRAQGEGSVYQRKDGRWVAVITLDKGKKKFVYRKTKREVSKELQLANQVKMQGVFVSSGDQKLADFLQQWLQDTAQPNLRPRTYIRYREIVELHIIPALGKVTLQKLSAPHLQKLYNQKRQEGYAPQTVQHIHRVLHRILNDAVRWNLMGRNVCDLVDAPRVPKQELQVLDVEQAQHFLEAAKSDPLEALYIAALTTGMREGELLALKWKDIDFQQGTIQVKRTIARVRGQSFKVMEPKTPKSRRSIHLAHMTLEALKHHRIRQRQQRLIAGAAWEEHDWVFCNSLGKPMEGAIW